MSDHAVIRANRKPFNMPCSIQNLKSFGHVECALLKRLTELHHLHDARCVGQEDSARMHRLRCMGNDLPWLGEIKDHAIEIGFVDSAITIT